MYIIKLNDNEYLKWYRGSNIKVTNETYLAKAYKTEKSAENALSKIAVHGYSGTVIDLVQFIDDNINCYVIFLDKGKRTYLGDNNVEVEVEDLAYIMTQEDAAEQARLFRKKGRYALIDTTMSDEEIVKELASKKIQ